MGGRKIRKITIGTNYKDNSMHYGVGQQVYGGHEIHQIDETNEGYDIWISKGDEILIWKNFNKQMAISVEYDLAYE